MNRTTLIAVGILVLLAAGLWWMSSSIATPSGPNATSTAPASTSSVYSSNVVAPAAKVSTKGVPNHASTRSLLTQTGSYECDYSQVQESGQSSNVIYIYGGKLRAEFRSTVNGVSTGNLALYDGHYLYQWREATPVGTKSVLTSLSQLPLVIPKDLTSGAIYGSAYESVGWKCHPWLTDTSILVPPSYVTFTAN